MARLVEKRMAAPTSFRRSLRFSPVVWLLGLGACTSVLGIEDLHEGPRPGTAAAGGDANTAGSSNPGAGKSSGTAGASNSNGGSNDPSGGNQPNGGTDPNGGAGDEPSGGMSAAGAGGAPEPADGPVHGTVIDFWGKGIANIAVQVGEEQVVTDADGNFATEQSVPAEYDASLKLTRRGEDYVYGWVYQGLTRRDPVLQVFEAREDRYTIGYATVTSQPTVGANDTISAAWGTSDGTTEKQELDTSAAGNYFSPDWQGAESISGTAHALLWTINTATTLPTGYKSYDSKLIQLAEGSPADMTFNLKTMTITSGDVTGTVKPAGIGDRTNAVFARFSSGAAITLASHTPTADAFSYVVPQLANASISVAASDGDPYGGAYAVVHKDGLGPGEDAGMLTIPAPAITLGPVGASAVDDTTKFTFKGSASSAGAYVVHIEASHFLHYLYIVTTHTTFTIPKVLGGAFTLAGNRDYYWNVQTHGAFKTVDQMAGPNGFADAYSGQALSGLGEPHGTRQESGTFTRSDAGYFTRKCDATVVYCDTVAP